MRKLILFFLFFCIGFFSFAQVHYIKGTLSDYKNKPVFLTPLFNPDPSSTDTTISNYLGEFVFKLDQNTTPGLYKILFKDPFTGNLSERGLNIIYNHENVIFTSLFSSIYNEIKIVESEENKVYYKFLFDYIDKTYNYTFYKNKLYYYTEDPESYSKIADAFNKVQLELDLFVDGYIKQYPGMFVTSIIKSYKVPFVDGHLDETARNRMLVENYFNHIDFTDTNLFHTDIIGKKVLEYIQYQDDPRLLKDDLDTIFIRSIDKLLTQAYITDRSYSFVLSELTDIFERMRRERVLTFIADYAEQYKCHADTNSVIEQRLMQYKSLTLGNPFPDFDLKDVLTNKKVNLQSLKAKYTLIVFWGSFCSHCTVEMPKIHQLYKKYSRDYFEVVAISLDSDSQKYLDYLTGNGLTDWYNIADFKGWASPLAKKYAIKFTPNTFLLNKNKEIVLKPDYYQLELFLENNKGN